MVVADRETILDQIARERALLDRLEREAGEARARLHALEASVPRATASSATIAAPTTPAAKVALFRRLFRGRDDVYPRYWENPRNGRRGYAPACSNEWVRGVCDKPRVKCGECPNQAFIPVGDQAVLDHLQGRHVIGVYPMLEDGRCWLLAVDFDKQSWVDDVGAFVETCRSVKLPVAVERSRSGDGAHVWFFFSAPLPASDCAEDGVLPDHRDHDPAP